MRVYICGPMTGLPEWNHPAFNEARARWQAAGHQVFCPAANARAMDWNKGPTTLAPMRAQLTHVMTMDVACVLAADAIALLPGWERSGGATIELALAQYIGLEIFDAMTMKRIDPPKKPWAELAEKAKLKEIHKVMGDL